MYRILGADQAEYGPASAEAVRQWITQGRVNAQTRALAEGTTEWKPLAEFTEFQDVLSSGVPPVPLPSAGRAVAAPGGQQTGLATTSLVLGVLSICGGLLTGIPAIITGIIAYQRTRRDPARYGGSGLAIAGLVLGGCSLFFTAILAGMTLPALAKAKARAQQITCVNHLKQVGLAARMYASDHKEMFPLDFQSMSKELTTPKILVCPSDRGKVAAQAWEQCVPEKNISYEFLRPGAPTAGTEREVIFRCTIHGNECYGDGSVMQGSRWNRRTRF